MAYSQEEQTLSVAGMWVTEDARIHQKLLDNGRYDEARDKTKHLSGSL